MFVMAGGTNRAHWEDVTENTPLTFVNDCVSFTTTVSARYWLIDCRHIEDATKMATELYRYKLFFIISMLNEGTLCEVRVDLS